MIRYKASEVLTRLVSGDRRSPLAESSYLARLRSKLFRGSFLLFGFLTLLNGAVIEPLLERAFAAGAGVLLSSGVSPFISLAASFVFGLAQASLVWSLVASSMSGWRTKMMPETALAGHSLESLAFFPARSLMWGWLWGVVAGLAATVALELAGVHTNMAQAVANFRVATGPGGVTTLTGMLVMVLIVAGFLSASLAYSSWNMIYLAITATSHGAYLARWIGWTLALFAGVFAYLLGAFMIVAWFGSLGWHGWSLVAGGGLLLLSPFAFLQWCYALIDLMLRRLRALEESIADEAIASKA